MRLRILLLLLFISICHFSFSENIDSLWNIWKDPKQPDTTRLNSLYDVAWGGFLFSKPDSAYTLSKTMLDFAEKRKLGLYVGRAYNLQATYFYNIGDYTKSMELHRTCMKIREQVGDKKGISSSLSNIGVLYKIQGDFTTAIDYYTKSLKIKEELGDQKGIAISLNNIGNIYSNQMDYNKALDCFSRGLSIMEKMKDEMGIAGSLANCGMIYYGKKDFKKAEEYYNRSLVIREKINDKPGIARTLGSLGTLFTSQNKTEKALEYYKRCLQVNEEVGDKQGIANALTNLGSIYLLLGQIERSIELSKKALELAQGIRSVIEIKGASENLYSAYRRTKNYGESLKMYELSIAMRDSINNEQSKKEVVKQEFKYEYEKKAVADSIRAGEEKKIIIAKFKQERTQRYALYGGVILMLLFGAFMFNRFRVTSKQKNIIEEQKQTVELKQMEILDSIRYAKRIQRSLLPTESYIERNLKKLKNKNNAGA